MHASQRGMAFGHTMLDIWAHYRTLIGWCALLAVAGAASLFVRARCRALRRSEEEAHAGARAKSVFLANMSHEIRTPMTAILGFAEMLMEPALPEEGRIAAIDTIRRNGEYLLTVVNDILDLSKVEAGKMNIEKSASRPGHLMAEVLSLMAGRAAAKGLALNLEYAGAVPETIQTDPTRLRQILINLVGNAIKFTEAGSVRLVARLVRPDAASPLLELAVIDTGIGISAEYLPHLFQPFMQADDSHTRQFGGTGLGLMISKRLANMLGGDITVQSRPGIGSEFRVTVATGPLNGVPLVSGPGRSADALSVPPAKRPPVLDKCLSGRILVAEDGPDNQRLISAVLSRAGAEVAVVSDGRAAADTALRAWRDGVPYDIVLMDMQMPVMDGYAATRHLRREGYHGKIVALTAHEMAGDRERCLAAGCDDYAPKPITRNRLIELARRHARTAGLRSVGAPPADPAVGARV